MRTFGHSAHRLFVSFDLFFTKFESLLKKNKFYNILFNYGQVSGPTVNTCLLITTLLTTFHRKIHVIDSFQRFKYGDFDVADKGTRETHKIVYENAELDELLDEDDAKIQIELGLVKNKTK